MTHILTSLHPWRCELADGQATCYWLRSLLANATSGRESNALSVGSVRFVCRLCPPCPNGRVLALRDDVLDDSTVDVGQSEISARVAIRQFGVIKAQ